MKSLFILVNQPKSNYLRIKKCIAICIVLFNTYLCFSQNIEVRGTVVDSITMTPISYASVGVKALGIGTITNQEGKFRLVLPNVEAKKEFTVNYLGYKPLTILLKNGLNVMNCKLVPAPGEIREVIIMPEDTLRNLLRQAFRAIPKNYPTKPTSYEGFYREVQKANDTLYLNFTEAVLEVYKQTYGDNPNFGQIRVIKSRKNNFPGLDTINNTRFYGGPFLPITLDFVFSHSNFINPKQFKHFRYWFRDTKVIDGNDVFIIGFEHKNDSIKGLLYLDKKTLAYVGVEMHKKQNVRFFLHNYRHGDADVKVSYIKYKDKWHISYVTYNSTGYNTELNKKVYLTDEYVTTLVRTDSVIPISFQQEFAPLDILSIKANDYSTSDWKDYNIIQENSAIATQIQNTYSDEDSKEILAKKYLTKRNKKDQFFPFISHFSSDFSIGYLPFSSKGGIYQLAYQDDSGNKLLHSNTITPFDYSLSLYNKMIYSFDKHWGLFFSSIDAINSKQTYNAWDFGIQYFIPLSKHGRKWFADFGIAYSIANYKSDLGRTEKLGYEIYFKNTTFNTNKVDVFIGKRLSGIKPQFSIIYKLGKFIGLTLSASSLIECKSSDRVYFKEASGFFLTRKSQSLTTNDSHLQLSIDNISKTSSNLLILPYQVILGLHFSF